MASARQYFKLLSYMKKPKPWRKEEDGSERSSQAKARTVARICRRLVVNRASITPAKFREPVANRKERRKRKAEPPFLIRNCISGRNNWDSYARMMQQWAKKKKKEEDSRANSSFSTSVEDESNVSGENIGLENMKTAFAPGSATSEALLRSFYTVWHIGRITRKSLKTSEETETALKELSNSPTVEKCLHKIPKSGISAEIITDKSKLSKKALQTLHRWARMVEDVVEDGYESGYEDDPVQVWNRAVQLANASHAESTSINVTGTTTTEAATTSNGSFGKNNLDGTPKRRRSERLLKAVNLED